MLTKEQIESFIKDNRPTAIQLAKWGEACKMNLTDLRKVVIQLLKEGKINYLR